MIFRRIFTQKRLPGKPKQSFFFDFYSTYSICRSVGPFFHMLLVELHGVGAA